MNLKNVNKYKLICGSERDRYAHWDENSTKHTSKGKYWILTTGMTYDDKSFDFCRSYFIENL